MVKSSLARRAPDDDYVRCDDAVFFCILILTLTFIEFKSLIVPTLYYTILFWIYWLIAAWLGILLVALIWRETEKGLKATAALLLVPVLLRVFLIK